MAQRRKVLLWLRRALLSRSILGTVSYGDAVPCVNVSLDTRDQNNEEAVGPGVDGTPFKSFSGENMLNGCLRVKVRVCMSTKCCLLWLTSQGIIL